MKKKFILTVTYSLLFLFGQDYNPETGEIFQKKFDPLTGEVLEIDKGIIKNDFDDIYNQSTIVQENIPLFNSPRYRLVNSLFTKSELEMELTTFPDSKILLKKYHKMRRISFIGCGISFPMLFFGNNAPLAGIAGFYGGLFFTIYAQNKAENILRKAIWVYNREKLKNNLFLK